MSVDDCDDDDEKKNVKHCEGDTTFILPFKSHYCQGKMMKKSTNYLNFHTHTMLLNCCMMVKMKLALIKNHDTNFISENNRWVNRRRMSQVYFHISP